MLLRNLTLFLVLAWSGLTALGAEFPLRDGDVWVMAGDSITAQHLHSNYFEAFCFARYPEWKFAFRNSGVGGHTIPSTLARFEYDIAAWKPTVVSVELGMNDKGGTVTPKFVENMKTMVERIRSASARPVILAASPVNDGSLMAGLSGGNQRLHEYAVALQEFAAKEQVPYADQFHALVDLWGRNKPRENLASTLPLLTQLARNDDQVGVEQLRAFLAAQAKSTQKLVSMQGDPVHPGPNGQLLMAAALLKGLGANGFVSSATLDASGKLVEAKGCRVDGVKAEGGKLEFDRQEERLPFPLPDGTLDAVALDPTVHELSDYTLTVKGLKSGFYGLKINGVELPGSMAAVIWEKGVNLTSFAQAVPVGTSGNNLVSPVLAQSRAILQAVSAKESLVSQWRGLSQRAHAADAAPELKTQLAALTKQVEQADDKIRAAVRPQTLHFELFPVP